jgi:thiol-disulfide isomerase/thioredoxin
VSLADYRGKALLLEIFSAWCPHCAAEAPHLRKLADSLDPKRYAVVAIDGSGEGAPTVFAYHAWYGLPFPALVDLDPVVPAATYPDHGTSGPVSKAYKLAYFPTFYVIDPAGRITWRSDGEQPDALLRQELRRAAGE